MAPVLPTINIGPQTPVDMGNVFNPVGISTEQYVSGPVNFYGQALDTSIDTGTDDSTDDTTDNTSGPNIYDNGKGAGDVETSFNELNKAFENTELLGVSDINLNSDMFKSADLTQSRFSDVMKGGFALGKQGATPAFGKGVSAGKLPKALEVGLGIAGLGVFSGMAAVFGGMNQAQMGRLAAEINANGGAAGAMMKLGNISIGRFPGQMNYVGTTHGYNDAQLAGMEAMKRGFVPGTLVAEVQNPDGTWTKTSGMDALVDKETMAKSGGTYDPTTGSFKYPGGSAASGTLDAATLHAANFSKQLSSTYGSFAKVSAADIVTARTLTKTSMFGTVQGKTFKDNLTTLGLDNMAKNAYGVDTFANLEKNIGGSFSDSVKAGVSGHKDFSGVASGKAGMDYSTVNTYEDDDPGGSTNDGPSSSSSSSSSSGGDSFGADSGDYGGMMHAMGGRIGYAPGGEAGFAQRPEFVGGNQTQPDGVSVADDQPRDVQEGTFVINAAAADFAGRDDIEKMLRDAYKKVGDTGQSGVSQEVAINVSKGEVMIPPHIAKVIGYDKLNKINNRGKKEIARRQEAAGGGFIDRKKFAKGDKVTLYRGEPLDSSKVVATDYGYGKEDVGKFHTPDVKRAGRFAAGAGKGNQVIKSRKVTIDELFDGVEEAWKTQAKKKTEYFAKLPESELNKNLRFVRELKRAYLAGERSLDSMAMFLQEQVFHDDKSRINFIETFKNDPKSAGKLAGRALTKVATKATPPLAILGVAAEVFTPSDLGISTLYDDSFMDYQFTPKE